MNTKTVAIHAKRLQGNKFTKSEIGALIKGLNAERFSECRAMSNLINDNTEYAGNDTMEFNKGFQITKEQTELGIAWLNKFCFGSRGPRKQDSFSEHDLAVIKSFTKFRFVGVMEIDNGYGCRYLPVYRTYGKTGSFDYCPIHWSKPIVFNRKAKV